jgi:hypothetical protein
MLKAQPIEMITAPNFFKLIPEWSIIGGNSASIWFQLQVVDSLGTRRWLPATGALMKLEFMRARSTAVGQATQTFQKTAAQDASDKSLFRVDLSAQDSQMIISGSVKFLLTEGANTTSFQEAFILKRTLVGAGC